MTATGLFGIGFTQLAYPGSEEHASGALILPFLIYLDRYPRAERGNVGLRAMKTSHTELDVGFAATLGSHSLNIPARRGMADLGTLVEFVPRLKINRDSPLVKRNVSWGTAIGLSWALGRSEHNTDK